MSALQAQLELIYKNSQDEVKRRAETINSLEGQLNQLKTEKDGEAKELRAKMAELQANLESAMKRQQEQELQMKQQAEAMKKMRSRSCLIM
eukprot:GILI01007888.1.p1 GENE.GILI01007888.1~~GILI01007888.1.p1  ORF type:complete len:104 (+),score=38.39 GILI01007888.1:40-312(+)